MTTISENAISGLRQRTLSSQKVEPIRTVVETMLQPAAQKLSQVRASSEITRKLEVLNDEEHNSLVLQEYEQLRGKFATSVNYFEVQQQLQKYINNFQDLATRNFQMQRNHYRFLYDPFDENDRSVQSILRIGQSQRNVIFLDNPHFRRVFLQNDADESLHCYLHIKEKIVNCLHIGLENVETQAIQMICLFNERCKFCRSPVEHLGLEKLLNKPVWYVKIENVLQPAAEKRSARPDESSNPEKIAQASRGSESDLKSH